MFSIRKHKKKLLAVFTALLMIVFIVDIGARRAVRDRVDTGQRVVGRLSDGTEVRLADVRIAEQELFLLDQLLAVNPAPQPGEPQFLPLWEATGIPPEALAEWRAAPITFLLLREEARNVPVFVSPTALESLMNVLALRLPDGRTVSVGNIPDAAPQVRAAVHDLMLVVGGFSRMADVLKVSQPLIERTAIEGSQQMRVSVVPLSIETYLPNAPDPTDEQLNAFFRKYADVPPGAPPSADNPLGLGYRYPPRVKAQWIEVPRESIEKVVRGRRDDYTWERDANVYYLQHQKDFPTTQPSTQPATQPSVRPFEEVREQVIQKVMAPEVQKLNDEIRRRIENTMIADYQAFTQSNPPSTAPATAPGTQTVSSLGVPYDSFEYLERLAQEIQKRYGVLPTVASLGEYKSQEQLAQMQGIGGFARDIFRQAAPIAGTPATSPARDSNSKLLQLWQPSAPQVGDGGAITFIYRIAAADPAHAPADVSEIADAVRQDWKNLWAWDQAMADAQELVEAAAQADLREAGGDRPVTTVGPFPRSAFAPLEELKLTTLPARAKFVSEAYQLLNQVTPQQQHPARIIELPSQKQILVAQLLELETRISLEEMDFLAIQAPLGMRQEWARRAMADWFSFGGVATRLGYVDRESADRADDSTAAAMP